MNGPEHVYQTFETRVISAVPLPLPPCAGAGAGGRTLRVSAARVSPAGGTLVWRDGRFDRALYRTGPDAFAMVGEAGGFAVHPHEIVVDPKVSGSVSRACASGIGLWLQLRGRAVIHASAVETDAGVVGLVGPSGRGKSTTAALLVARGCRYVSDEMLVADERDGAFVVPPGSARFRLWPEVASAFGDASALEPVAAGARKLVVPLGHVGGVVCPAPRPLAALVMLERSSAAPAVDAERLSARGALRLLLAQTYMGEAADAMGLQTRRLHALAALVRRVPVFALRYPSGLDRAGEAVDAILRVAAEAGSR